MNGQRLVEFDHFFCDTCRKYVYDEVTGDASRGIHQRTRVDKLPDTWHCPVCGAGRDKLRPVTMYDDFADFTEEECRSSVIARQMVKRNP